MRTRAIRPIVIAGIVLAACGSGGIVGGDTNVGDGRSGAVVRAEQVPPGADPRPGFLCSTSRIDRDRWVTAAHCVDGIEGPFAVAVTGSLCQPPREIVPVTRVSLNATDDIATLHVNDHQSPRIQPRLPGGDGPASVVAFSSPSRFESVDCRAREHLLEHDPGVNCEELSRELFDQAPPETHSCMRAATDGLCSGTSGSAARTAEGAVAVILWSDGCVSGSTVGVAWLSMQPPAG